MMSGSEIWIVLYYFASICLNSTSPMSTSLKIVSGTVQYLHVLKPGDLPIASPQIHR